MRVQVVCVDGKVFSLEFPGENPVTVSGMRGEMERVLGAPCGDCSFFWRGQLVTRATRIAGDDEVVVSMIRKSEFPLKAFPGSDLALSVDRLRFPERPNYEDIPTVEVPRFMRCTRESSQIQAMASDLARSFCESEMPTGVDYSERDVRIRNRRRITSRNATAEEEQTGEEEEPSEEEDLDAILELRDSFEENLSQEHEEMVDRLAELGFDRNFVTPILFMCQGDEVRTREFLTDALQVMEQAQVEFPL